MERARLGWFLTGIRNEIQFTKNMLHFLHYWHNVRRNPKDENGSKSTGPLFYLTTTVCYFHGLLGSAPGRSAIKKPTLKWWPCIYDSSLPYRNTGSSLMVWNIPRAHQILFVTPSAVKKKRLKRPTALSVCPDIISSKDAFQSLTSKAIWHIKQ